MMQLALGQAAEVRTPVAVVLTSKRRAPSPLRRRSRSVCSIRSSAEGVTGLMDDATAAKELRSAGFSIRSRVRAPARA